MRFLSRSSSLAGQPGTTGTVRIDRRVGAVLRRARPGDIVVIDHLDLDRSNAEALLDHGVGAVVNASALISGRYANLGPEMLARAGVVLVDQVGPEVFARLKDGAKARVHEGTVYVGAEPVATGRPLEIADVESLMDEARGGLSTQLQSFAHNASEFLRREQDLLLHGRGVPELRTRLHGRPVVVVVRDFEYEADLRSLRQFIREQKPVLVGVDAGADALLAARQRPDLVVVGQGGLAGPGTVAGRAVTDKALTSAGEVVLHADSSDRLLGAERLDRLGVRPQRIAAGGTTEDIALLLADLEGASLIVTVGTHATLDDFLDRQRSGLASTFLTRLRVGPRLVDAKTVPTLYAGRVRVWQLLLVLLVGMVAVAAAVALHPAGGGLGRRPVDLRPTPPRLDPRTVLVISFRYHVVSLVAVLLALAAGVVLGSGPLQRGQDRVDSTGADAAALATAETRIGGLEQSLAFSDAYARATAATLTQVGLQGRAVTLVTLPGAADETVASLTDLVTGAGAAVTARVEVGEKMLDVANRQLVTELATQMQASVKRAVQVPAGASGYERMGRLVARAIASETPGGARLDGPADSILAGVSTADLLTTQGNIDRRGSLVLVVTGAPYGTADQRSGAGSILATLVSALDKGSDGVVVAGPGAAGDADGLVTAVRDDPTAARQVSTVDVADRAAGGVVTVLALEQQSAGGAGQYGSASAADGPVPTTADAGGE